MCNNGAVDIGHKATSMLFVAKAVLRQVAGEALEVHEGVAKLES